MWQRNKPLIIVVLLAAAGYGVYMLSRYVKIREDSARRAAETVHPKEDDESVSEVGYVYSMRDEVFLQKDNRVNLVWFIKVPATGNRYSCSYQGGFAEFRVGDDVRIIRPKDVATDAGYGYVMGLHERISGKAALVWVIDEDELEVDIGPDE